MSFTGLYKSQGEPDAAYGIQTGQRDGHCLHHRSRCRFDGFFLPPSDPPDTCSCHWKICRSFCSLVMAATISGIHKGCQWQPVIHVRSRPDMEKAEPDKQNRKERHFTKNPETFFFPLKRVERVLNTENHLLAYSFLRSLVLANTRSSETKRTNKKTLAINSQMMVRCV